MAGKLKQRVCGAVAKLGNLIRPSRVSDQERTCIVEETEPDHRSYSDAVRDTDRVAIPESQSGKDNGSLVVGNSPSIRKQVMHEIIGFATNGSMNVNFGDPAKCKMFDDKEKMLSEQSHQNIETAGSRSNSALVVGLKTLHVKCTPLQNIAVQIQSVDEYVHHTEDSELSPIEQEPDIEGEQEKMYIADLPEEHQDDIDMVAIVPTPKPDNIKEFSNTSRFPTPTHPSLRQKSLPQKKHGRNRKIDSNTEESKRRKGKKSPRKKRKANRTKMKKEHVAMCRGASMSTNGTDSSDESDGSGKRKRNRKRKGSCQAKETSESDSDSYSHKTDSAEAAISTNSSNDGSIEYATGKGTGLKLIVNAHKEASKATKEGRKVHPNDIPDQNQGDVAIFPPQTQNLTHSQQKHLPSDDGKQEAQDAALNHQVQEVGAEESLEQVPIYNVPIPVAVPVTTESGKSLANQEGNELALCSKEQKCQQVSEPDDKSVAACIKVNGLHSCVKPFIGQCGNQDTQGNSVVQCVPTDSRIAGISSISLKFVRGLGTSCYGIQELRINGVLVYLLEGMNGMVDVRKVTIMTAMRTREPAEGRCILKVTLCVGKLLAGSADCLDKKFINNVYASEIGQIGVFIDVRNVPALLGNVNTHEVIIDEPISFYMFCKLIVNMKIATEDDVNISLMELNLPPL